MITFAPIPSIFDPPGSNVARADNKARSIAQVLTKTAKSLAEDREVEKMRRDVERMVKGEEYVTGSRMRAYENVAAHIGKSPSWVRKFIGRDVAAALGFRDFLRIASAYGSLCDRIEAAAATERKRAEELRRMADEALESRDGVVAGLSSPTHR